MAPRTSQRNYYCTDSGCYYGFDYEDEDYFDVGDDEDDEFDTEVPTPPGSKPVDFELYMKLLTGESWGVEELAGGKANQTVRATRPISTEDDAQPVPVGALGKILDQYSSVILKHAPPTFYKSPELKFDPYRQTLEARVLTAFQDPRSPLHVVTQTTGKDISTPTLLDHCAAKNILIETDLGDLPTVELFLTSPRTTLSQATKAGELLATYLAELHHSVSFTTEHPGRSVLQLEDALMNSYSDPTMISIIDNVEVYMKVAGVPDFEALGKLARDHWKTRVKSVFGHGDIWYGSVLVEEDEHPRLKICDFEFAGPNHPAGDIAQFGAYLHLSTLSPLITDQQRAVIYAFADAFYSSYFRRMSDFVDDRDEYLRSLVLMHGWEFVNAAAWRHYLWCDCTYDDTQICPHTQEMVTLGASILRAASNSDVSWVDLKGICWLQYFDLVNETQ